MLKRVFEAVAAEHNLEWMMRDATVICAHAQAAGPPTKGGRTPTMTGFLGYSEF